MSNTDVKRDDVYVDKNEDIVESTSVQGDKYDDLSHIANAAEVEKKLVRTLDRRLMTWAFFGYFANGLDRNNMPNAQTTGLSEDLNLVSNQYNWAITMFFIGYIV
jgi:sugar phosphate permease